MGVCAGIAENMNVDPNIVRAGFVVGTFVLPFAPLVYIALGIALPKGDAGGTKFEDPPATRGNINKASTVQFVYCRSCGAKNQATGKFCVNCGAEL